MKVKLGQIVNSKESFIKLFKSDLPVKVSYRLGKMIKQIDSELGDFDKKRFELIKKSGEEILKDDKPTGQWSVKPEHSEAFMKDVNDLLSVEVDLNFEPLSLDSLGSVELSPQDVMNLEPFLNNEVLGS